MTTSIFAMVMASPWNEFIFEASFCDHAHGIVAPAEHVIVRFENGRGVSVICSSRSHHVIESIEIIWIDGVSHTRGNPVGGCAGMFGMFRDVMNKR